MTNCTIALPPALEGPHSARLLSSGHFASPANIITIPRYSVPVAPSFLRIAYALSGPSASPTAAPVLHRIRLELALTGSASTTTERLLLFDGTASYVTLLAGGERGFVVPAYSPDGGETPAPWELRVWTAGPTGGVARTLRATWRYLPVDTRPLLEAGRCLS